MGHRAKIMLMGGYGWKDVGDEAMPMADIANLRRAVAGLDIVMLSPFPHETMRRHGEYAIEDLGELGLSDAGDMREKAKLFLLTSQFLEAARQRKQGRRLRLWKSADIFFDELESCDLLFNVGGGNINSVIPTELYKKCSIFLAAKLLGKPVLLSGQTIGPFSRRLDAAYARFCLNQVDMISFRDNGESLARLRSIGVKAPAMEIAADDAMTIRPISKSEAEQALASETSQGWRSAPSKAIVAMNIKASLSVFKGIGRTGSLDRECAIMAELADSIIELYGAKVFFVPTDYSESVDDRRLHERIVSLMKRRQMTACLNGEYSPSQLKGLLALADAAIGSRYHFCVFAAGAHVPFLGIASGVYQRTKLNGLAGLCGLPECYADMDMEEGSFPELMRIAGNFMDRRAEIRASLRRVVPALEEKSLLVVKEAVRIIAAKRGGDAAESPACHQGASDGGEGREAPSPEGSAALIGGLPEPLGQRLKAYLGLPYPLRSRASAEIEELLLQNGMSSRRAAFAAAGERGDYLRLLDLCVGAKLAAAKASGERLAILHSGVRAAALLELLSIRGRLSGEKESLPPAVSPYDIGVSSPPEAKRLVELLGRIDTVVVADIGMLYQVARCLGLYGKALRILPVFEEFDAVDALFQKSRELAGLLESSARRRKALEESLEAAWRENAAAQASLAQIAAAHAVLAYDAACRENGGAPPALFGAGAFTSWLVQLLRKHGRQLPPLIYDDFPKAPSIGGVEVIATGSVDRPFPGGSAPGRLIVMSTDCRQEAFRRRCGTLFPAARAWDLYEGMSIAAHCSKG